MVSSLRSDSELGEFFPFDPSEPSEDTPLVLQDPKTRRVFRLAKSVAETPSTVLLSGESGVGKEVFARFIHQQSPRHEDVFLGVNCAAFSESLLESELFGHEKGSFSGAAKLRAGVFERAHGGTLLLDEVSEMPLDLQTKLLRVIQERGFFRVGGSRFIEVDVRLIATTNRNLKEYVKQGGFRHDLFYRLNVFPIEIPPLRERTEDILPLALFYGRRLAERCGRNLYGISEEAANRLKAYHFPGNVRELVNILERAVILCHDSQVIDVEHLILDPPSVEVFLNDLSDSLIESTSFEVDDDEQSENEFLLQFRAGDQLLTDIRRDVILKTLDRFDGNQKKTAEALGISARTIRNKLKDYDERGD